MKLIDERTLDGSRQFASLPRPASWEAVRNHLLLLPGAEITHSHDDWPQRASLDFHFGHHRFFIKAHDQAVQLFVRDPQCADLLLYQIGAHFEQLLGTGDGEAA